MAGEDKLREYLRRVTVELTDARRRLAEAEDRGPEPIAVIGMSCRFPGAENVDSYWQLLSGGRSGVLDEVPDHRFDLDPWVADESVYTRRGAFLPDIAGWDARFFGSSPREALRMDPQQRLLMELAWEAMEDAGTPPASLAGSRTGVLVGFSDITQYAQLEMDRQGTAVLTDPYIGQGSSASVVAGRIAYHFDLRGPAMAVDTACSSSLVAVHLAADALRRGECDLAVAGGAFLAMLPDLYIHGCATSMLSRSGECRTFDAAADGYVLGEGGGLVVLARLSDAVRAGRRIRAVIRGSAVNQDGRTNGLTAPNRSAQVDVIRRALSAARVSPEQVDYLEAHGSATPLGDQIELSALNEVFGARSPGQPLHVGAVKTNIGHTQAAAGAAGLIKTILVLEKGVVPPNLNMTDPAAASLASDTVRPAAGTIALPDARRAWMAGVSSFGWSGTNAHLVLESRPAVEDGPAGIEPTAELLPVSAAGEAALQAHLARLAAGAGDSALADLAYTLQTGRAQLEYRRAVVAADAGQAAAQLSAAGGTPGVRSTSGRPRVAFLLPGAAEQPGGAGLYRDEPAFTAAVDECVSIASERCGLDLRPALFSDPSGQPVIAHLALFTSQYAIARLLAHYGVTPDLLISDGAGDLVAACLAGVLSPADALPLAAERARLAETADSAPLAALLASVSWQPAAGPVVASRSSAPLTAEQATSPQYWLDRLSAPPQVAAGSQLSHARGADACVVLGAGRWPAGLPGRDTAGGQPLVLETLPAAPADERAALLQTCGRLWELGVALDWNALRRGNGRLTGLPCYPFQRERYWIDLPVASVPAATGPAAGLPAVPAGTGEHVQLLTQQWSPADGAGDTAPATGRFLLIADTEGIADALGERLRRDGAEVVQRHELRSGELSGGPVTVVDLSTLDRSASGDAEGAVVPVAGLLAALGADVARTTRVVVVTRGGHAVAADEQARPAQAAVAVLPVIANQEYVNVAARNVDLDPAYSIATAADVLAADLRGPPAELLSAYRADQRHVPGYASLAGSAPVASYAGGTYLITGGLGDIGLTIAEHLIRRGAARVVLTSRRGAPADPQDPRHQAIARLRGLGAEVATPAVDVTDQVSMRALFAAGRIDGVVHAAADAAADTFRSLQNLDETSAARQFGAKVGGARVLAEVFGGLPAGHAPDWCMAFSSTSALLGGAMFGGYAAANAALTALGRAASGGETRWIAVNWDTWACTLDKLDGGIGASLVSHSMSDAEALDAFDRLVARAPRAAVVAAGGLTGRLPRPAAVTEPASGTDIRHPRPDLPQPYSPPLTPAERTMAGLWAEILGVEPVGIRDNFFDLGGTSLLAPQLFGLIKKRFGIALPTVTLFEAPTVRALAGTLDRQLAPRPADAQPPASRPADAQPLAPRPADAQAAAGSVSTELAAAAPAAADDLMTSQPASSTPGLDRRIAIVGMAGRFPGAGDVAEFWRNLCGGVESISFFLPEELIAAGVDAELVHDPLYVPARPVLDDIAGFDAAFFGMSPRMAALTDPQQRLFLEVCWEALEQAGYCQPEHRGRVGVYGGTHISTYLLGIRDQLGDDVSAFEIGIGNEKDALTTSVSYLFDLHGPSVAVQTFCSTSLVAAHLAVQSLRSGECEMALAGGVSIRVPDRVGHRYEQGGMESPDGHVRTFDAKARGSMFGDGATVVVLKRLSDALRDGDNVWGVIRGSAMNNDGALKVGFTAPSVTGQAEVIRAAMADAGVTADDVGYVEAHGSGTPLGDPIEVAALTQAFGPTHARQYCALGSVKTNIGHLDRASGTAGLIKTSLTLWDGVIPPTLHFTNPNPEIDFENSPFFVNNAPLPWAPPSGRPRIAGLNSLGMGGTNVHMVLEQPPVTPPGLPGDPDSERRYQVLPVSARTATAADASGRRLGEHLQLHPGVRLADVAYTLQAGRKVFEHRRAAVVTSVAAAAATLTGANDADPPAGRMEAAQGRPVAFLFAGVGEQYPGMVGELYRREPVFRSLLRDCLDRLAGQLPGVDLTGLLTEGAGSSGPSLATLLGRSSDTADAATAQLRRTEVVQPLMFAVDYALAGTLMAWGVRPTAMLGYSLGEYVAACLAGVLSLDDALKLVVHRAQLISTVEPGSMAGVQLGADELRSRFQPEDRGLDIASVNGPQTVVAGPTEAVTQLLADLREAKIAGRLLQTTHAFHSRMLAPLAGQLTAWIAANIRLSPPALRYFSNVTGGEADAALVCAPEYWARHMCQPVQFSAGADALLADPELAVIEIGPGRSLTGLIRAGGCPVARWPLMTATLPAASDSRPADAVLADCLARLWLIGVDIDWAALHGRRAEARPAYAGSPPGRIPLPTYPFERQRYWIERTALPRERGAGRPAGPATFDDIDRLARLPEEQWLNLPMWRQVGPTAAGQRQPASWLVFTREGEADRVLAELRLAAASDGATLTVLRPGDRYRTTADGFTVRPGSADDVIDVLRELRRREVPLDRAVHLWTLDETPGDNDETVSLGLHTLVALARAAGELGLTGWSLDIVTAGTQQVVDGGVLRPAAATVVGAARVIPLEYPSVVTRLIDAHPGTAAGQVVGELRSPQTEPTVALRGGRRWLCGYETVPAAATAETGAVLRENGVYLITGGLGGIGLGMAEHLARDCRARLVLFGRRGLPPRAHWAGIASGERAAEDSIRGRVARVLEIIELGAEVEVISGDVAEPADIRRAVDRAHELFGGLHGVLHAAGVPGTGLIQFKEPGDSALVLAPKLAGTRAIAEALRIGEPGETALDFLVLFSSIASATGGGPGQVDYCGANAYLDVYAAQLTSTGRRALSVDWGEWVWNAWDEGLDGYDDALQAFFHKHRANFGITFEEGWRTLLRALASGESRVVVSTQDLPSILRFSAGFTVEAVTAPANTSSAGERHPRPELVTPYQEPSGETQQKIAALWARALRLDQIGAADNFFELGGNSLLGIALLATLRETFTGAELAPHILHEAPSVAALARIVDGAGGGAPPEQAPDRGAQAQGQLRRAGLKAAAARRARS